MNHVLYGLYAGVSSSLLLKVNPTDAGAYVVSTINLLNVVDIAFDTSGTLYAIRNSGEVYSVNPEDGSTALVANAGINIGSIAFDPTTNELYGTGKVIVGAKDKVYKIDLVNGGNTLIGNTGFNVTTNSIEFDADGNMYGIIGAPTEESELISIDKTSGVGASIGMMGYNEVTGLAFARSGITGVQEAGNNSLLPKDYSLNQNYPNPFNPTTTIQYTLPVNANVKVVIYNLLGEVVKTLINNQQSAGVHNIVWNAEDSHGSKVGSGVYFYELKANGVNGSDFSQIRKMILLK